MNPSAYLMIGLSLALNIFFIYAQFDDWLSRKIDMQERISQSQNVYFDTTLFSDGFALKDYSGVKYTLEDQGKKIIQHAREFHSSPALIQAQDFDKYLCAGFLYELSQILWDTSAPIFIGMMDPNSKQAADAWQLPYAYEYVGGKILEDFSDDFSKDLNNYWENITSSQLKNFFKGAFGEPALLGDIGFFYKDTNYLASLQEYGYMNSHIGKNIGVSDFQHTIDFQTENLSQDEIISQALSCESNIYMKMKPLLEHYEIYQGEQRIVLHEESFYVLQDDNTLGEKVIFKNLDTITLRDVSVLHFFEGAKVQSLFEMSCNGDFFPMNIMQINPRLIEKI